MGFRYRKSVNLVGGFKVNFSKSGVGYSWGTKGYRITKTARGTTRRTYSLPGTGLSYVDESGKKRKSNHRSQRRNQSSISNQSQQQYDLSTERAIESGDLSQFKEAEVGRISSALESVIRLDWIGSLFLWALLLVPVYPLIVLIPIAGAIMKIIAHTIGRLSLEYTLDNEMLDEHLRRINAWRILAESKKKWQILTEQFNSNRKVNAGAGRNIKRTICRIDKSCPFFIKTNVDTVQILLHNNERLIILPDRLFFVRKRKVGAIDYSDLRISTSSIQFVEDEPIPKDSQVVGHTWQYVNKNGTPDLRFKNNKQIPVCLYGQVLLRSSSSLNVELQVSNTKSASDFAELIV